MEQIQRRRFGHYLWAVVVVTIPLSLELTKEVDARLRYPIAIAASWVAMLVFWLLFRKRLLTADNPK